MNGYILKNYPWALIIALYATISLLTGCSSPPPIQTARQYCYTSQEIKTKDREVVSSETTLLCNDDPIKQSNLHRAGLAKNCGHYEQMVNRNGRIIKEQYISCQKPNGNWESFPAF
jgi:hypothetical protein